eukprot:13554644-Alexandrium_andersonii.AAC.1
MRSGYGFLSSFRHCLVCPSSDTEGLSANARLQGSATSQRFPGRPAKVWKMSARCSRNAPAEQSI